MRKILVSIHDLVNRPVILRIRYRHKNFNRLAIFLDRSILEKNETFQTEGIAYRGRHYTTYRPLVRNAQQEDLERVIYCFRGKYEYVPLTITVKNDGKATILGKVTVLTINNRVEVRIVTIRTDELFLFCFAMNDGKYIWKTRSREELESIFKTDYGVSGFVRNFNFEEFGDEFEQLLAEEFPKYNF